MFKSNSPSRLQRSLYKHRTESNYIKANKFQNKRDIWFAIKYQSGTPSSPRDDTPFSTDFSRFLLQLFQLDLNNYASLVLLIRPRIHLDVGKQSKGIYIPQSLLPGLNVKSITRAKLSIQHKHSLRVSLDNFSKENCYIVQTMESTNRTNTSTSGLYFFIHKFNLKHNLTVENIRNFVVHHSFALFSFSLFEISFYISIFLKALIFNFSINTYLFKRDYLTIFHLFHIWEK